MNIVGPTLEIRVAPDEEAPIPEPLVLLTNRDLQVPATPAHLIWRDLPASKEFQMLSFEDKSETGDVFKNISVENKTIECDFVPPASDPPKKEYYYVITIKYQGEEYDTSERTAPGEGRPVIRN